jgi:hypothetical protein
MSSSGGFGPIPSFGPVHPNDLQEPVPQEVSNQPFNLVENHEQQLVLCAGGDKQVRLCGYLANGLTKVRL